MSDGVALGVLRMVLDQPAGVLVVLGGNHFLADLEEIVKFGLGVGELSLSGAGSR